MQVLAEPTANRLEDMQRAPWQLMLLVKWVCQDRLADQQAHKNVSLADLNDLRQRLWEFPERADLGARHTLPVHLFLRQMLHAQIGLQRPTSPGFVREAALLAQQEPNHPLRRLFEKKTGINVLDFMDLAFATYVAILEGKRAFSVGWFDPLRAAYSEPVIGAFVSNISRTFPELVAFCRGLPSSRRKVASELYEFPVLSRYPFLRTGDTIECWHPAVFYRGMEGFVHSVLSEEGQDYMDRFSKMFERHVVAQARKLDVPFLDEQALQACITSGERVPDGLLLFPDCNIFIESKAGIFDESVMTVGHAEIFAHKTRALRAGVAQAWSASVLLRSGDRAPPGARDAKRDYLLIITNKELSASRGTTLASMYPPETLAYPTAEAARLLPLDHIYVLSIEDFERLMAGASAPGFNLPSFLDECVEADRKAETAVHFFDQHLDGQKVPRRNSELVTNALQDATARLGRAVKR